MNIYQQPGQPLQQQAPAMQPVQQPGQPVVPAPIAQAMAPQQPAPVQQLQPAAPASTNGFLKDNQVVIKSGRLLQGDCFEGSDTDQQGRLRTDKSGNPKMQWYVGVAIPKTDPNFQEVYAKMQERAQLDQPNEFSLGHFAWKLIDGDTPEYSGKAGFAGHYLIKLTSGFAPEVFNQQNQTITDKTAIKRGDFVQVLMSVKGNGEPGTGKPGIYLNIHKIKLICYGDPISNGPSAETIFGELPAQLPQGGSQMPVGGMMPIGGPALQTIPQPQLAGPQTYAQPQGLPAPQVNAVAELLPAQHPVHEHTAFPVMQPQAHMGMEPQQPNHNPAMQPQQPQMQPGVPQHPQILNP